MYKKKGFPKKPAASKSKAAADAAVKTATYLVIVESPSKCKKIEEYLGPNYQCIASKGHLRTIDGMKSIDSKHDYQIHFSNIPEKESHIRFMRSIISQYSPENILLATDDDREGEAIAWHICKLFELPVETTRRILFHEITKPALHAAVETPTIVNLSLVYAQHARQVLDILVGYKVSPFLWKHIHNNRANGLSAGRCQTPALRLVYDNALLEKNKEKTMHYKTTAHVFSRLTPFSLDHDIESQQVMVDFLELSKTHRHILSLGSPKETHQSPPKPFTTSKLLQTASSVLHCSPKTTMDICQKLYQEGLITYMRTDSAKYSPIFIQQCREFIENEYGSPRYVGDTHLIENGNAANPHEAIRVTRLSTKSVSDTNPTVGSMYRLIWRNTVESCMSPAKYNTTVASLTAPKQRSYSHRIDIPLFLGWRQVTASKSDCAGVSSETECQNQASALLMFLSSTAKKGDPVDIQYIDSTLTVQHRHSHYTEASLIQKLEDLGIGRPSTFASIVETIQERGYVQKTNVLGETVKCIDFKLRAGPVPASFSIERTVKERVFGAEKNKLVIQPTGIITLEFLMEHFQSLFSYDYTKTMEEQLDQIASREYLEASTTWHHLCRECHGEIKQLSKPLAKLTKQTYPIDDQYELVFTQYGASLKHMVGDTVEYKSVRKDIRLDLEKLKRGGEYTAAELMEIPDDHLGVWQGENVTLKTGRYGAYVECGEKRISVKAIEKPLSEITFDDVLPFLDPEQDPAGAGTAALAANKNVLRVLTPVLSIRRGRFGPYAFYQRPDMGKPSFHSLKGFKEGFAVCNSETLIDWLRTKYNIQV
jgi:DNA topoisomerase-1